MWSSDDPIELLKESIALSSITVALSVISFLLTPHLLPQIAWESGTEFLTVIGTLSLVAAVFGAVAGAFEALLRHIRGARGQAAAFALWFTSQLAVAGIIGIFVVTMLPRVGPSYETLYASQWARTFDARLDDYSIDSFDRRSSIPYVRGKAVALVWNHFRKRGQGSDNQTATSRAYRASVNYSLELLDEPLRAHSPRDVGTIVWVEEERIYVGGYTGGGLAYRYECKVRIIDARQNVLIAEHTFRGGPPPSTTYASGDHYGSLPRVEIADFVNSLERRPLNDNRLGPSR